MATTDDDEGVTTPDGRPAGRPPRDPGTLAVHAGEAPDPTTGALEPPLTLATTYAFADAEDARAQFAGETEGYIYSRWRNPSVEVFERKLAALEGAEAAVGTASGMAAIFGALTAHLNAGDHVVAPRGCYAETARLLRETFPRYGVEATFVDATDPGAIEAGMRPNTRVLWLETPANPTLALTDLDAAVAIARRHDALTIADETFATPHHQQPLAHGVDLVVHSATKGLGGHGDVVGGAVAGSAERCRRIRDVAVRQVGGAMSPFAAWLLARGMKTLPLRAERSAATALALATRLEGDRRVRRVRYPGLPSHPQAELARRQMRHGFGGLIAFEAAGGFAAARRLHDRVTLISRAVSLGDARSLLTHPASTTHVSMPPEARAAAGIGEGLLRLSVGLEGVDDLWVDLDQALGDQPRE